MVDQLANSLTVRSTHDPIERVKTERERIDAFWGFFTSPPSDPLELYLIGGLFAQSKKGRMVLSDEDLRILVLDAIRLARLSSRQLTTAKDPATYIGRLIDHRFLQLDSRKKEYIITRPALILGESLSKLQDPQFLHWDEKYLEHIVVRTREILQEWVQTIKDLMQNWESRYTTELELFAAKLADLLKRVQELMNFTQLESHLLNIGLKSLELAEILREVTGEIQVKYIQGIHSGEDVVTIKQEISGKIEIFGDQVMELNKKRTDLQRIINKNERNIRDIEKLSEIVHELTWNHYVKHFQHISTGLELKIHTHLSEFMFVSTRLIGFTSQLQISLFRVIADRLDIIGLLFGYLRQIVQNSQLIGDIYNLWNWGVLENARGRFPESLLTSINHISVEILREKIGETPLEESSLKIQKKTEKQQIRALISKRNELARKHYEQEQETAKNKIYEDYMITKLADIIVQHAVHSDYAVEIDELVYQRIQNTPLHTPLHFPLILARVWQRLEDYRRQQNAIIIQKREKFRKRSYNFGTNGKLMVCTAPVRIVRKEDNDDTKTT